MFSFTLKASEEPPQQNQKVRNTLVSMNNWPFSFSVASQWLILSYTVKLMLIRSGHVFSIIYIVTYPRISYPGIQAILSPLCVRACTAHTQTYTSCTWVLLCNACVSFHLTIHVQVKSLACLGKSKHTLCHSRQTTSFFPPLFPLLTLKEFSSKQHSHIL